MEEFKTIQKHISGEITEKKSKFIADVYCVDDVKQVEQNIKEIKKKYYDAKHHCYAYKINTESQVIEKCSDDGEPSGTAGAPILNIINKNNLSNILIVVTRYFGGILLGTGGLVKAYTEATQEALKNADYIQKVQGYEFEIKLDYPELEIFKYYCKNNEINIKNMNYIENVELIIEMEENRKKVFLEDIESKKLKIKEIQEIRTKLIDKCVEKNK